MSPILYYKSGLTYFNDSAESYKGKTELVAFETVLESHSDDFCFLTLDLFRRFEI